MQIFFQKSGKNLQISKKIINFAAFYMQNLLIILLCAATMLTPAEQMRKDYLLYAALDCMEKEDHEHAFRLLDLCYRLDSSDPTVNSLLGGYIESLTDIATALPYYKTAYDHAPSSYWYRYAISLYAVDDQKTLKKLFRTMQKLEPRNIDILQLEQQMALRDNNYKQALKLQDAMDKLVGEPTAESKILRVRIAYLPTINKLTSQRDYPALAFTIMQMGDTLFRMGQHDEAFKAYDQVLRYAPDNAYVLNNYAYMLAVSGGDLSRAEQMSARAIRQDANNPTFLDTYAWILHLQGQDILARFYIQQAYDKSEKPLPTEIEQHYRIILQK